MTERKQKVVVNGTKSDPTAVISGIPQGSVLGPLLFLIYVNDLPEIVKSIIKLFADHTKLYRSINNESDRILLQKDLDAVMDWSSKWQLPFSTKKCKTMTVGAQGSIMGKYTIDTEGNKTMLTLVKEAKDLGIKFDDGLNFATHISEIITKGNQRIGLIRRSFTFMNKQTFLSLYKALFSSTPIGILQYSMASIV